MTRRSPFASERGFTLIEVLVASTVFVGVLVIGVSSFSSINRLNEQIVRTRQMAQTGNFVMETLVRDIRTATGEVDPMTGGFKSLQFPFDFVTNPDTGNVRPDDSPVAALRIRQCQQAGCRDRLYRLSTTSQETQTLVLVENGQSGSLLPDDIGITDLSFTGASHQVGGVQPFVHIRFTLTDLTASAGQARTQTFSTTVTSLVYSE